MTSLDPAEIEPVPPSSDVDAPTSTFLACRDCSGQGSRLSLYVCPACSDRRAEGVTELTAKARAAVASGDANGIKVSPQLAALLARAVRDIEGRR